jgi:hypothetical protein
MSTLSVATVISNIHPKKQQKKSNYFLYNSSEDYSSIPNGAKNGIMGGLEILLDAEAFDYSYW